MGTTNVTPAHIDPRRLSVDVESLLGRAAAIGMQIVDLPPTFGDALMAWLRARALGFAQQQRTGIALGRDLLRRGVVRAWTCVMKACAPSHPRIWRRQSSGWPPVS